MEQGILFLVITFKQGCQSTKNFRQPYTYRETRTKIYGSLHSTKVWENLCVKCEKPYKVEREPYLCARPYSERMWDSTIQNKNNTQKGKHYEKRIRRNYGSARPHVWHSRSAGTINQSTIGRYLSYDRGMDKGILPVLGKGPCTFLWRKNQGDKKKRPFILIGRTIA